MDGTALSLTVFFDDPFWVGIFERRQAGMLSVCKVTFGAEPRDCEVYAAWLRHWNELRFSPPVKIQKYPVQRVINPKRMQRAAGREVQRQGMGTRAQEALKMQHEQAKRERKTAGHGQAEQEKERRFYLRQQKKKEKHRGR
ncbi:YjdF family protein [Christensenella tenuis]|mgnify:CR=1 FL=1|jgi:hypothetical protein|uniref:YjdF family protein n=1 Tax=Christensenella tenuis TaxID=2763033 RepID=A0ABR7EIC0_9FIRM|nr:YjdF family protein [Christensenella tenuis]MBC5649530.1 YjdF family protein [Christensenella tenuis]